MEIIPVIDILDGKVVHAKGGQRNRYQPVVSLLCNDSSPTNVIKGFVSLAPFNIVYIADLDAIQNIGSNQALIERLCHEFPQLQFWLDTGNCYQVTDFPKQVTPVFGSETCLDLQTWLTTNKNIKDYVLSLDCNADKIIGQDNLLQDTRNWPDKVLLMALNRVGTNAGPDMERIEMLRPIVGIRKLIVAGGICNKTELEQLATLGIAGVLLATALHNGKIGQTDLQKYLPKNRLLKKV